MQRIEMPATGAEPGGPLAEAVLKFAQPAAAAAALLAVIWGLSEGFWPSWPLWTAGALLGLGLFTGPLAQLVSHRVILTRLPGQFLSDRAVQRYAQPIAALVALLVLSFWLPAAHSRGRIQPMWVIAFLLDLGLIADPLTQLLGRRRRRTSVQPVMAVVASLLLTWELSIDGWYFKTSTPYVDLFTDKLPLGDMRIVLVLLYAGLIGGQLIDRTAIRRLCQPAATLAALCVLFLTLGAPSTHIRPAWPLWWAAVVLAFGLAVDLAARFVGPAREQVLTQRVNELSRTRRGVLDVQATELRRIERDLHDGAQVRLVALSMKLGRAEDRYHDDPETAALLREAREDATAAIRELRELARGIAPPVLADRGLGAAVHSLAQRSGSEVAVTNGLQRRPPPAVETAAYFVVAESLTNAAKHAPGARVEVVLDERGGDLFVEVTDFGPGGADPAGSGLTGLRQRVEALDGALHVTSPAGVGTQVEVVISCGW